MKTATYIPSGHTGETDSPSEVRRPGFRRPGHKRAYDPREPFAAGVTDSAEMRAANAWARNNPRRGISLAGALDTLTAEYEAAAHALDGRAHVQWDVWHEQLFGAGRYLEAAIVAARFLK